MRETIISYVWPEGVGKRREEILDEQIENCFTGDTSGTTHKKNI